MRAILRELWLSPLVRRKRQINARRRFHESTDLVVLNLRLRAHGHLF